METKKKYLGRLNLFYVLLFCLLLGFSFTTCYAVDPDYTDFDIPIEFWTSLLNYSNTLKSFTSDNNLILQYSDSLKEYYDSNFKSSLKANVLNYNINADERNLLVAVFPQSRFNLLNIIFLISNNTINNIENSYYSYIGDNLDFNLTTNPYFCIILNTSTGSISQEIRLQGTSTYTDNYMFNINNFDSDVPILNNSPFFGVNQKPLNILYFKYNNQFYNCFLNGFYNINSVSEPEQPSGDTGSGDNPSNNSGLGNITTPSGDNGGNINLLPIEQGITNLTNQISGESQRIIDNQNNNTQQVVNALSGETSKITNTLTDVPDVSDTQITSGDIERCLRI